MVNTAITGGCPDASWNDWKWQMRNRITDARGLSAYTYLSPQQSGEVDCCLRQFRMAITPYYASLMDPVRQDCPIRRQAVPVIDAPGGGGKIPIAPEYIAAVEPERLVLKNYKGDLYYYPNI